ncbi:hypothetical protein Tco_0147596, partial [Tanacetum coccineum]
LTGGTVTGCLGAIDNFLKKGKLEQVVAIVKSCYPNALGDLNVTLKDLSGPSIASVMSIPVIGCPYKCDGNIRRLKGRFAWVSYSSLFSTVYLERRVAHTTAPQKNRSTDPPTYRHPPIQ